MDITAQSGAIHTDMPNAPSRDEKLREASEKLESAFLAEMLKAASFGKTPDAFGGGEGEDQFASFLVQAQADKMVEAGGIGLAEQLFEALKEQDNGFV
ncbi:rod binding protein [Pacificibacter maritimus]|uniref:Rod binding protein n=1 Tax=Pacificibacter maritimus TaxID=762213 RepID=A0A3N4USF6_9RHOB|nr:rod-binding protein [Pacificibacter maritimus]RPE64640.1 rod binding protein [Pacificibacter maritimus]